MGFQIMKFKIIFKNYFWGLSVLCRLIKQGYFHAAGDLLLKLHGFKPKNEHGVFVVLSIDSTYEKPASTPFKD